MPLETCAVVVRGKRDHNNAVALSTDNKHNRGFVCEGRLVVEMPAFGQGDMTMMMTKRITTGATARWLVDDVDANIAVNSPGLLPDEVIR